MENARRGYQPTDARDFFGEGRKKVQTAAGHVTWLMDQGYGKEQAIRFVGDHFQLSLRQREALMRGLDPTEDIWRRRSKRVGVEGIKNSSVIVDGFNTIITLETAFAQGTLIRCRDGAVRDLAGLHGSYRIIPETEQAILLMLGMLKDRGVKLALILLNRKISNSGNLKALIEEVGESVGILFSVAVIDDPAKEMLGRPNVITTNTVLMERVESWYGLTAEAMPLTGNREMVLYTGKTPEPVFPQQGYEHVAGSQPLSAAVVDTFEKVTAEAGEGLEASIPGNPMESLAVETLMGIIGDEEGAEPEGAVVPGEKSEATAEPVSEDAVEPEAGSDAKAAGNNEDAE